MSHTIRNENELREYISEFGDDNSRKYYFAQNAEGELWAIFGCTSASEGFGEALGFVDSGFALVITDEDHSDDIGGGIVNGQKIDIIRLRARPMNDLFLEEEERLLAEARREDEKRG